MSYAGSINVTIPGHLTVVYNAQSSSLEGMISNIGKLVVLVGLNVHWILKSATRYGGLEKHNEATSNNNKQQAQPQQGVVTPSVCRKLGYFSKKRHNKGWCFHSRA